MKFFAKLIFLLSTLYLTSGAHAQDLNAKPLQFQFLSPGAYAFTDWHFSPTTSEWVVDNNDPTTLVNQKAGTYQFTCEVSLIGSIPEICFTVLINGSYKNCQTICASPFVQPVKITFTANLTENSRIQVIAAPLNPPAPSVRFFLKLNANLIKE